MSANPHPQPLPASAFDGDCGVSFVVALGQVVDVRLRGDGETFRGTVRSIGYEATGDGTDELRVHVVLREPIKYPATAGFPAAEQWHLHARMDEIFPIQPDASAAASELLAAARDLIHGDGGAGALDPAGPRVTRLAFAVAAMERSP